MTAHHGDQKLRVRSGSLSSSYTHLPGSPPPCTQPSPPLLPLPHSTPNPTSNSPGHSPRTAFKFSAMLRGTVSAPPGYSLYSDWPLSPGAGSMAGFRLAVAGVTSPKRRVRENARHFIRLGNEAGKALASASRLLAAARGREKIVSTLGGHFS